jgi:hypothetical protein
VLKVTLNLLLCARMLAVAVCGFLPVVSVSVFFGRDCSVRGPHVFVWLLTCLSVMDGHFGESVLEVAEILVATLCGLSLYSFPCDSCFLLGFWVLRWPR